MPATVIELIEGTLGKGKRPSATLLYQVRDDAAIGFATAYALVHAYAPATFEGLFKQQVQVKELSPELFSGEVSYGPTEMGEDGDAPDWSFELGGESHHITHSLETIASYAPPGKTPPNHNQALNVRRTGNGGLSIDGLDTDVDSFTWEETHYLKLSSLTPDYLQTLKKIRGASNASPWRIWKTGEVKLDAVTGRKQAEVCAITFRFSQSDNVANLTIADIVGINKKGWEYLWTFWAEEADEAAQAPATTPEAVYVEQIRKTADFAELGLADPWNP